MLRCAERYYVIVCRSMAPGHGACSKSMSKTITMHGYALTVITDADKHTLGLDSK